jgi:hypothetical protein
MRTHGSEESPETSSPIRIDLTQPPARLLSLQCLLRAYQDTLDYIDGLQAVFWFQPSASSYVPLPALSSRFLTRYFFVHHLKRSVDSLRRRYEGRAALASQPDREASERAALGHFADSLPHLPTRRLVLGFIAFAVIVALAIAETSRPEVVVFIQDAWSQVVTFNFSGLYKSATMFDQRPGVSGEDLANLARALLALLLAVYLPLTALVGSFRLYQKLANEFPKRTQQEGPDITAAYSLGADRLSMFEARFLAHFGAKVPSDIQVDLVRSSLIPLLVVVIAIALFLGLALYPSEQQGYCKEVLLADPEGGSCPSLAIILNSTLIYLFPFLVLPLARLRWVGWTWRSRKMAIQYGLAMPAKEPGHASATRALVFGIGSVIVPVVGVVLAMFAFSYANRARKRLGDDPDQRGTLALTTGRLLGFASIVWFVIWVVDLVSSPIAA